MCYKAEFPLCIKLKYDFDKTLHSENYVCLNTRLNRNKSLVVIVLVVI